MRWILAFLLASFCVALGTAPASAAPWAWERFEFPEAGLTLHLPDGEVLTAQTAPEWDYDSTICEWYPAGSRLHAGLVMVTDYGGAVTAAELEAEFAALGNGIDERAGLPASAPRSTELDGRKWLVWRGRVPDDADGWLAVEAWGTRHGARTYFFLFYADAPAALDAEAALTERVLRSAEFAPRLLARDLDWTARSIPAHGISFETPQAGDYSDPASPGWDDGTDYGDALMVLFQWRCPQSPLYSANGLVIESSDIREPYDSVMEGFLSGRAALDRQQLEIDGRNWLLARTVADPGDPAQSRQFAAIAGLGNRVYFLCGNCIEEDEAEGRAVFDRLLASVRLNAAPPTAWAEWVTYRFPQFGLDCDLPGGGSINWRGEPDWEYDASPQLKVEWVSVDTATAALVNVRLGRTALPADLSTTDWQDLPEEQWQAVCAYVAGALPLRSSGKFELRQSLAPLASAAGLWRGFTLEGSQEEAGFHGLVYLCLQGSELLVAGMFYPQEREAAAQAQAAQLLQRLAVYPPQAASSDDD